ncbi:MAG: hypothetical protein ACXWM7_02530 [Parachlamydiaceae bacterium]
MRHVKSERLKKLESELTDLEQWLKLGLVPKKDAEKHKEEILAVKAKIEEEKERLQFLKESGEIEEYVTPKRPTTRAGYTEMPTIPDIDMTDTAGGVSDTSFEMETSTMNTDHGTHDDRDDDDTSHEDEDEEEESYFSDKNRWKRGGIVDPDADDW